jgi:hypothetical protein
MTTRRFPLALALTLPLTLASCGDGPLPPPTAQCAVTQGQASSNPASTDPSPPQGSPFATLVDDFAGPSVNTAKWTYYDEPARTSQDDRLIVGVTASTTGYSGLLYRLPHRFAGSSFMAEVGRAATGGTNVETVVGIATPDDEEYILLTSFGGNLQAVYNWRGRGCNDPAHRRSAFGFEYCLLGSIPFDGTAHRFRRLREQNGTVFLELSANGQSWNQPPGWSVTQHFIDPGALHGLVAAGTPSSYGTTTAAHFENVNTTLPAIPGSLEASCPGTNDVRLVWERRSVNESGYRVERRTAGGAFLEIGTVGANIAEFRDPAAAGGATYEYRVRAANAAGSSAFSRTVTVAR